MSEIVPELTEDMAVIGPGEMLADARKVMGLTQQQVADKLNFRLTLVNDIELDKFDTALPATYNRGYLKNYAKLVNVSIVDILASYDLLHETEKQSSEMLSFSKGTKKEAENNLLMWISYLILAALVGMTILWWLQGEKLESQPPKIETEPSPIVNSVIKEEIDKSILSDVKTLTDKNKNNIDTETLALVSDIIVDDVLIHDLDSEVDESVEQENSLVEETKPKVFEGPMVNAIFQFAGDCWVNIYSASGERIAWGIKKSGYVMNIKGQAPLSITLGKPELVFINFEGQSVDMSKFRRGHIAKFDLPIEE